MVVMLPDPSITGVGVIDPREFKDQCWPDVRFYDREWEIIDSVVWNDETYVPAGNKLGKDYTAAFICLYFFLTRHPVRVVTTSAKDDHLRVLWGEIGRFVQTSRYPLAADKGGMLVLNHQDVRKVLGGRKCPLSYMTGLVASSDSIAAMQGHHIAQAGPGIGSYKCCGHIIETPMPRTLFVSDESSSVSDDYYKMASTWFNRALVIGNTWPCDNFFKRAVEGNPGTEDRGGDVPRPTREGQEPGCRGYYRKVIRITAEDSPNVRLAKAEIENGKEPSGELVVPGVKTYDEYAKNRVTWDPEQQSVSLDARFYKGKSNYLYPEEWLFHSGRLARQLASSGRKRDAAGIGMDPAEGGDKSTWAVGDLLGLIELVGKKTPDTDVIPFTTLELMRRYGVPAAGVVFDRGGGGKQHADRMRGDGYPVRSLGFGESVMLEPKRGLRLIEEKLEGRAEHYAYVNRRAQLYWELRLLLDPSGPNGGFALPHEGGVYAELFRQLALFPLKYDSEGRFKLPPKRKKDPRSKEITLEDLMGCSPDESDALVLMVHAILHKGKRARAGGPQRAGVGGTREAGDRPRAGGSRPSSEGGNPYRDRLY